MLLPYRSANILTMPVCLRCGYRLSRPVKRCPNCERGSWAKPLSQLSSGEKRGLDARGFDLEGRRRGLGVFDPEAEEKRRDRAADADRLRKLGLDD